MPLCLAAAAIKARSGAGGRGHPQQQDNVPYRGPCCCKGGCHFYMLHWRRPARALRCMPPVQGNRQQILDCGDDGLLAYSTLKKMRFLQPGQPSADELAQQAAALYQAIPPARLARQRGIHLEHSAAIDAYLRCGSAAAAGWQGA